MLEQHAEGGAPTVRTPTADSTTPDPDRSNAESWQLRLYVAGKTANCVKAFANLKKVCEENLAGRYDIEVIDLLENPRLAAGDEIVAIPTLVRKLPTPVRKILGNLSDTERVLVGLQLRPKGRGGN